MTTLTAATTDSFTDAAPQYPAHAAQPDTMIMAVALPIMLLLLFVYVFGGAMTPAPTYTQLRRARNHPALRGIRRLDRPRSASPPT